MCNVLFLQASRDGPDWGYRQNEEKTHTEKKKNPTRLGSLPEKPQNLGSQHVHYIESSREAGLLQTAGQEGVIITARSIRRWGFGIQWDQGHRCG